jgi:hypothetical protein
MDKPNEWPTLEERVDLGRAQNVTAANAKIRGCDHGVS